MCIGTSTVIQYCVKLLIKLADYRELIHKGIADLRTRCFDTYLGNKLHYKSIE